MIYETQYGVTFVELNHARKQHTYRRFYLLPTEAPYIESADAQTHYIDADNADGSIDLTELGDTLAFQTRHGKFSFKLYAPSDRWAFLLSRVMNELHGKRMYVVLDDDPDYVYTGRLKVATITKQSKAAYLTIEGDFNWARDDFDEAFADWDEITDIGGDDP